MLDEGFLKLFPAVGARCNIPGFYVAITGLGKGIFRGKRRFPPYLVDLEQSMASLKYAISTVDMTLPAERRTDHNRSSQAIRQEGEQNVGRDSIL